MLEFSVPGIPKQSIKYGINKRNNGNHTWDHGRYPARIICPSDEKSKNMAMGTHLGDVFLLGHYRPAAYPGVYYSA
jgi:hypothetical protein